MNMKVDSFKVGALNVGIIQDEIATAPDEFDDTEVFVVTAENGEFVSMQDGFDVETITESMQDGRYEDFTVFPLFAYVHSGVSLSLGKQYPFDCPWDSGQIGFVLVKDDSVPDVEKAAQFKVEEWNQYLSGDVYGYVIEQNGIHLDSCWGFYGFDYVREEAKQAAEWVLKNQSPVRVLRVKLDAVLSRIREANRSALSNVGMGAFLRD